MKIVNALLVSLLFTGVAIADQHNDPVLWSGGVSQQERNKAPDKGTKLVFFEKGGPYLADVQVTITDQSGNTVVDAVTEGPWLILDLPEGQYTVTATRKLNQHQETVTVNTNDDKRKYGLMFATA